MITFASLISGSSGNSTLISDGKTHILTDCGMSGARLKASLSSFGLSPNNLSAVLITHEHIDHVRGVGVIARRYGTPLYGTEKTLQNLNCGAIDDSLIHTVEPDTDFEIGSFGVKVFSLPHDAADPVGYSYFSQGEKLSVATDIGHINDYILSNILGSTRVLLESNHDVDMLQCGPYPFSLKQRILSDVGHLSNENAAITAYRLIESGTRSITLGHLSNENNRPEIAHLETYNYLTQKGVKVGRDMSLQIAKRYEVTDIR